MAAIGAPMRAKVHKFFQLDVIFEEKLGACVFSAEILLTFALQKNDNYDNRR